MTYSNTWSTTRPLGSTQANQIDDEIRALRLDIQERLNEIFEDFSLDPVVVDQSKFGIKTGKTLIVHGVAFVIEPSEDHDFNYADNGVTVGSEDEPIRAWVPLPNNVTVTKIEWLMTNGDHGAVSLTFGSLQFEEAAAVSTDDSRSTTDDGTFIVDSGPIAISTGEDKSFFLKADKSGGATFTIHAVRITYDTPDSRSTI